MKRKLLKSVKSTSRGLVGITEQGDKIPLSAPIPLCVLCNDISTMKGAKNLIITNKENNSYWEDILEARLGKLNKNEIVYFQANLDGTNYDQLPYNIFTRRK